MTTQAAVIQDGASVAARIRRLLGLATRAETARNPEPERGVLAVLRGCGYAPSAADPYVWVPCRVRQV